MAVHDSTAQHALKNQVDRSPESGELRSLSILNIRLKTVENLKEITLAK